MACCCCCAFDHTVDQQFTRKKVAKELQRYRLKGLGRTARLLRDSLAAARSTTGTLLDVGAGAGALTFALLDDTGCMTGSKPMPFPYEASARPM